MGIKPRHNRTKPTSWFDLFLATKGWFALIGGIAALALTIFSINSYKTAADLAAHGVWVPAEITRKRISRGENSDDYLVTFEYRADDRTFERQRDTGRGYYRAHDVGDQVQIKILPARPKVFEFREGQTQSSAVTQQIFAGIAGIVGCVMLWLGGSKANSGVLARRKGRRTVATISGFVEEKKSGKPTGRGYMIFHTEDGLRGESLSANIDRLRALGTGTKIVVFVRGRDVWWEGDVGPREERPSPVPDVRPDDHP